MNQQENLDSKHVDDKRSREIDRKPYCKPKLEKLGDLRSVTMGPSLGPPDDSSAGWPADTFL